MISYPHCKINLGLNIVEKRNDGFHNLESVFYPINWTDILEIVEISATSKRGEVVFSASGIPIDGNSEQNLCVKAYQLLNKDFYLPSIKMHLHKIIPMGAGLGGGSSDAAYTLLMLNEMFDLQLNFDKLVQYAGCLGSDCAFFIQKAPTYNWGRGDEYRAIDLDLSSFNILIVNPNIHVSTKEAFAGVIPHKRDLDLASKIKMPIQEWNGTIINDFEVSVFEKYPQISRLKEQMYQNGALYASMSGSGSSVFGIFDKDIESEGVFKGSIWQGSLTF